MIDEATAATECLPAPPAPHNRALFSVCPTCHADARVCHCLYDVVDPRGYVYKAIKASGRFHSPDEFEELMSEGITILHKLADIFDPHREGYEHAGRFSGFAAKYLRLKLEDAYHRLHPEHTLVAQPDGGRRWHYGERAVSLEAIMAEDPDRHSIIGRRDQGGDLGARVHAALIKRARSEQPWVLAVAKRIGRGEQPPAVARELGISEDTVRSYMRAIVRAAPTPGHQFAKVSELRSALESQAESDASVAAHVGELLGDGGTVSDIAELLGLQTSEVRDHEDAIRRVWHQIESEGA